MAASGQPHDAITLQPGTVPLVLNWRGVCVVPRFRLDIMENTKILFLLPGIKPQFLGCPDHRLVTILGKGYTVECIKLFWHMLCEKLNFKLHTVSHSSYVHMVEKVITEQHFILLPAKSRIIILYTNFNH
jgi:hypothetical protein